MSVTVEQLREILQKSEVTTKDVASFDSGLPLRKQGLDSLDMATFVFFIETEFDLSIPHTEYKNLVSLEAFAEALSAHGDEWAKSN